MIEKHTVKPDPLREKTFKLAIRVVKLYQYLSKEKHEFTMSKQLLRAGTNPGAMVREAANAESGSDFIHKLSIAQKETGETLYWLELLYGTDYLTTNEFESMNKDVEEVMKLLRSSILTKKKNLTIKTVSVISIILFTINHFL
jgi:four helix bundle protein